jgi:hypothetical protein
MTCRPRLALPALALLALAASACRDPVFFPEFDVDMTAGSHLADDASIAQDGEFVVSWSESTEVLARSFSSITSPQGDPFLMNADTTPARGNSSIARDASGGYVIVWNEAGEAIRGQRFDRDGTPIGENFTVITNAQAELSIPLVASDPSGNFVVAWTVDTPTNDDIFARRYDHNGVTLGDPLPVNTFTPFNQFATGIAMSASGFVVAWDGNTSLNDQYPFARLFDESGDPITPAFKVNSSTATGSSFNPDVAMNATGDFVVIWADGFVDEKRVLARRFDNDGDPVANQFQIRQATTLSASAPRVASDSFGNFLVVWEERPPNDFTAPADIYGRFFGPEGLGGSGEFRINQITTDSQIRPRPSLADNGEWIVSFQSNADGDFDVKGRKTGVRASPTIVMDPPEAVGASEGGSTLGNGVFEPGETHVLRTAWINDTAEAVDSILSFTELFTGPFGPTYTINDGEATYNALPTGQIKSCIEEADCFSVTVNDAIPRPALHWDALLQEDTNMSVRHTWVLHLGESFPDVPPGHPFYKFIETLFHKGVTGGCAGGDSYCPGNPVARAQMAVFLLKSKFGSAHIPPTCTGTVFTDVPCTGGPFDPWIEELAGLQITGGCGGGNYCPNNTVTRQQMAVFLLKTFEGFAYDPPDCTDIFDDVTCTPGTGFSDWIEELYNRGITGGCSVTPLLYCPTNLNNRGQMAVFLVKTFGLVLYGG